MKLAKFVMLTSVLLSACGLARGADYPVKALPASWEWTGFYVGINGGYTTGHASANTGQTRSFDGGMGGAQIGYNYQVSPRVVLGAQIDADLAALGGTFIRPDPLVPTVILADQTKVDAAGTARARVGVVVDRFLVYGSGGFAWARAAQTIGNPGGVAATVMTERHTHTGWAGGAGIEGRLAGNWTALIEYLHVSLGSQTYAIVPASVKAESDGVFVALNYHFR
jgi:outer membrane immunogenic protein